MTTGAGQHVLLEIGRCMVGLDSEGTQSRGTEYNIGKGSFFCVSVLSWYRQGCQEMALIPWQFASDTWGEKKYALAYMK